MALATIEGVDYTTEVELNISVSNLTNSVQVQGLFDNFINIETLTTTEQSSVFEPAATFEAAIETNNQLNIVVEKVTTVTVVDDGDIRLIEAAEDINQYQPVRYNDDDTVSILRSSDLTGFNRFFGINTTNVLQGEQARVRIKGILFDATFTFDVTKEIYIGINGDLVQTPDIGASFLHQVANALSPQMLLITYNEPVKLS